MSSPTSYVYTTYTGNQVDDELLSACATLFGENYGVWGPDVSKPLMPGERVKMTKSRLRKQCLGDPENNVLVTCTVNGELAGHAFATVWPMNRSSVCWITQLVVSKSYRRKGMATSLLRSLPGDRFKKVDVFGLVSSHPAACLALLRRAHVPYRKADLEFIRTYAPKVIETTTVDYVKTCQLRGSLFDPTDSSGAATLAYTDFFVDHAEPQAALDEHLALYGSDEWPFGALLDGHEFFIIVRSK